LLKPDLMPARTVALCLCFVAPLSLLHGCAPQAPVPAASAAPAAPAEATFAYLCPDGIGFDVRLEGELAWLTVANETFVLRREPAASGVKYGDGRWAYWSKGEKAVLEGPGVVHRDCRTVR
jgi:membrane-bound inhibitor of C-type lysozyme